VTDNTPSQSLEHEATRITLPPWWKTLLVVLLSIMTATAAVYFEKGIGAALVIVPFISFSYWCDEANISWKNTPRLKGLLLIVLLALSTAYLLTASQVGRIHHHKKPLIESGWLYDLSVKVARLV
jgi:cell division protein FtsW (lipid II flippase)